MWWVRQQVMVLLAHVRPSKEDEEDEDEEDEDEEEEDEDEDDEGNEDEDKKDKGNDQIRHRGTKS